MDNESKNMSWWQVLKRNFNPNQVAYFTSLLKNYGQKLIDKEPKIIIDTIHSVKGGEANNVVIYSKTNWAASFSNKNLNEKSDEKRVYYTGVTRARDSLHLLSTNHRNNYPIGEDYFTYIKEDKIA